MYNIKTTKLFDKRFANLGKYFLLSNDEIKEATEAIKYSMVELQQNGVLPDEYDDHVLDDLLVIYYRVDKKKNLRFTTITTHRELRKGNLN